MTAKPGIRETKKQETRRALGFAAFELASTRGLDGFVVEDVTDQVGVSRRTFFNYFNRKEEAVVAVSGFMFDDALAEMQRRSPDEPLFTSLQAVVKFVCGPNNLVSGKYVAICKKYPELVPYDLAVREVMVTEAYKALVDRLPSEQRSTFYPLALIHAVIAVLAAAMDRASESPEADVDDLIDEAFGYLRHGFDPTSST
ncbi:TetR/AcrR family transcriptional regulator [Actinocrispum wychmicini]|uniref:TetR family transcriptional regulator n=1 Tax=Actinocrispum wychmicini TaxID=1213861 RepID=A0A4R2JE66_9PSEU|nr:TetR/AcrR family transcriptional regulator [Actinocrispum wychmicini]TCO55176.1 TetR family transcriptional regulator [Actinocrispum wychmicini]